jgi:hypothetical protein
VSQLPNTYTLISSNVLTTATASVTFSAIPATFTDLVVRFSVRGDQATNISDFTLRFNSDSASNYSETRLLGYNGTNVLSDRLSSQTNIQNITVNGASSTASTFSNGEIYLPNYTSTANKPISVFDVVENNSATSNQLLADAVLYRNSTAISSATFTANGNFVSGSSFYLYGISKS